MSIETAVGAAANSLRFVIVIIYFHSLPPILIPMLKKRLILLFVLVCLATAVFAYTLLRDPRNQTFRQWASDPQAREDLIIVQRDACPGAPFILPADGWIGLLYGDPRGPYSGSNPHQGIDIFSDSDAGVTPVYAAYDGYVTREPNWRSTLIMRVPDDPLNSGQ